ncbi:MAG TPA: LON peptidase substrate-binding domain-containing protein [Acidimicrobiales bacterium]|nr:LON peptidase substrate-binding domain-containing protein [Acidimicrobiales bacterium]
MAYRLPMFPLSTVLFPGGLLSLHVFEPRYRRLVADCLAGSGEFGVVLISRGSEVGGGDQRVSVGSVARVRHARPLGDGRWLLAAEGCRRIRVARWLPDDPYPVAEVDDLPDDGPGAPGGVAAAVPAEAVQAEAARAVQRTRALLSELDRPLPASADLFGVEGAGVEGGDDGDPPVSRPGDVEWLSAASWQLCAMAPLSPIDAQGLLEGGDPLARLADLAQLMDDAAADLVRLLGGG